MAASTEHLHFHGFKTWEPGDMITVYRCDQSVGYIQYLGTGELYVRLTFGGSTFTTKASSPEAAKEAILTAFCDQLGKMGLGLVEPNRPPEKKIPWAKYILDDLRTRDKPLMGLTASQRCVKYMRETAQRMLDELDDVERKAVSKEAREFIRALKDKEMEEAEKAAAV